jgi:hypothetical protein
MELQQTPQHQGMYNPLSKEILSLMNKQLILPWTRRHRCRTSSSQCSFCEEYILWFSIAQDILKYISPRDEIKLPELELPNINELKQQQLKQQQLQQQQQQQQTVVHPTRSPSKPKFSKNKNEEFFIIKFHIQQLNCHQVEIIKVHHQHHQHH